MVLFILIWFNIKLVKRYIIVGTRSQNTIYLYTLHGVYLNYIPLPIDGNIFSTTFSISIFFFVKDLLFLLFINFGRLSAMAEPSRKGNWPDVVEHFMCCNQSQVRLLFQCQYNFLTTVYICLLHFRISGIYNFVLSILY